MALTDPVDIPADINRGVRSAKQQTMLSRLGNPRGSYDQQCRPVTNPTLAALMGTASVGPFRVTGLRPAVESLTAIMAEIRQAEPEVHDALGTAGMLCARRVRGSTVAISNHSWGTAVDLNLDGRLDVRGDGRVQVGLTRIAPIFNRHGWFWGAGFGVEDAMHFEVGDEKIREWHAAGVFHGAPAGPLPDPMLSLGDRGPEVIALQRRLNELGAGLAVDGIFGPDTRAAVMAFQAGQGLAVDGIVGPNTREALGL